MHWIVAGLLVLFSILRPLQAASYEVYRCVDARGLVEFKDLPCDENQSGEILDFKKHQPQKPNWQEQVKQNKIDGIELLDIRPDGRAFIAKYTFTSNKASNEFMRVLRQYSGMNVNLVSVAFLDEGVRQGEAKLTPQ